MVRSHGEVKSGFPSVLHSMIEGFWSARPSESFGHLGMSTLSCKTAGVVTRLFSSPKGHHRRV